MEQIAIIFFALTSFLGMEDSNIAADKTTVTVYPQSQKIEITQQDLFAIVQSDADATLVRQQWASISAHSKHNVSWAKALTPFPSKTLKLAMIDNQIQPQLTLTYSDEKDLRAMGIWYNDTTYWQTQTLTLHLTNQPLLKITNLRCQIRLHFC